MMRILNYNIFCLLIISSCSKHTEIFPGMPGYIEKDPPALTGIHKQISNTIKGYYEALPKYYAQSSLRYPCIVFLPGGGQHGNGNEDLGIVLNEAIPELLSEKLFPPHFVQGNKIFSFVILIPQFLQRPTGDEVKIFIDFAINNYAIDNSRIYLVGLSEGAQLTCDVAAAYPSIFAAIVPMAGASNTGNIQEKCRNIAWNNLPVWSFHNQQDEFVPTQNSIKFIQYINSFNPSIVAKLTLFPPFGLYNHDAWSKASDPYYKENGMNIYQWMLQYTNKR